MTAQSFDTERWLTTAEIVERDKLRNDLDEERDALIGAVDDRRKEIRGFNAARKRIEAQLRDVRRELRTGKVFDSPQTNLFANEPPPATPPPPPPELGGWSGLTGEPRHGEGALLDPIELRHLITCVRPREGWPTVEQVEAWHEQVRADVQRWCRVEHTRNAPIAGLPLPAAYAMPGVLANISHEREDGRRKGKAGKRKATARKAPAKRGRKSSAPRGMRL